MTYPRSAFGVTPSTGRQQWPGNAGSTLALTAVPPRLAAHARTNHSVKEF
jgi:hypothetical protein